MCVGLDVLKTASRHSLLTKPVFPLLRARPLASVQPLTQPLVEHGVAY